MWIGGVLPTQTVPREKSCNLVENYGKLRDTKFKPGNPGKPPGTQNKLTKTVKETVLAVFNELQEDPKVKLSAWAKEEPTEFYRIAAKLIPTEVNAKVQSTVHQFQIEPDAGCDPVKED